MLKHAGGGNVAEPYGKENLFCSPGRHHVKKSAADIKKGMLYCPIHKQRLRLHTRTRRGSDFRRRGHEV